MKGWMIAAIVVIIAAVAYMAGTGQLAPGVGGGSGDGDDTSLGNLFHSIIDPVNPGALSKARTDCMGAGGTYFEQDDRIGCYDIPPGVFNVSSCSLPTATYMKGVCESISGTSWICVETEVGCKYV